MSLPASIGQYRIVSKLGEGGMGVVYEAEQQSPRRRVAVKVVRGGQFVDEHHVRMFQREADTLARLKHPNIGAIYESGRTEDGQHFFAMELVRGQTLDVYLKKRPKSVTPQELKHRLGLFRKIANAVHYAHQRGVIHRDLKPSNVIVTDEASRDVSVITISGVRLPEIKILDFGLARITEGDVAAATMTTEVGVIKGTLPYMSPEQARGNPEDIDLRTDVYALGVILFEMLAGQRPYDVMRKSVAEIVRVICEEPPRSLGAAITGVRRLDSDVETIVGKALEKEADRRYASAAGLAEDIERYLTSQPILARPPSTLYQLRKFSQRNRALVGGSIATFAVLVVGVVGSTLFALREAEQRREADAQRRKAEATLLHSLGRQELNGNRTAALAYAIASLESVDDPLVRRFALEALWRGPMALLLDRGAGDWNVLQGVDFSPDGRWLAVSDWGRIRFWGASGGAPVTVVDHETFFVGFSADSDRLVSGSIYEPYQGDGTVRVWSVPEGRPVRTVQFDTWAYLFFPITAGRLVTMDTNANPAQPLGAYSGDYVFQSRPLDGGDPTTLGRLSAREGRGWTDSMLGFALDVDPSATRLAYAEGRELYVTAFEEMGSAPPRLLARHDHPIRWVTFHPSGDRLAFAAADGEVRLLSLDGEEVTTLRVRQGPRDPALIRFDHDGSRLVTAIYGRGDLQVWDFEGPPDALPLEVGVHPWGVSWTAAFHPNDRWIATINQAGPALWPLGRRYPRVFGSPRGGVGEPVFAPDGSWIAAGNAGGEVRIWPLTEDGGERGRVLFRGAPVEIGSLAVDPGGRHLLVTSKERRPRILSVEDGRVRELVDFDWFSGAVAFGPHGRFAAVGGGWQDSMPEHAVIRVWDLDSGEVRVLDAGDGLAIGDLQFLPDLRLLSSGSDLRLWDLESRTHVILRKEPCGDIELNRNGRILLIVVDGNILVHDLEEGISRPLETGSEVTSVAFDPTGTIVVAGHRDGQVSVGPVTGGRRHLLLGHSGSVSEVAVSPDGQWIASGGGSDATLRLWPMPDLTQPPFHTLPYEEFLERLRALTNLRVVRDEDAATGYRLEVGPFPGWETVPTW